MQKMGDVGANTNSYDPSSDVIEEQDCETLLLHLPGFKKNQLRIQLMGSRNLRISGTRPLVDNKLISFQKDYPVSLNCDTNRITAKFEDGLLYVRQPKQIVPAGNSDSKSPPPPPPPPVEKPSPPPKTPVEEPSPPKTLVEEQPPPKKDGSEELKPVEGEDGEPKGDSKVVDQNPRSTDDEAVRTNDQREKVSRVTDSKLVDKRGGKTANNVTDYYKLGAGSSAEKIKKARQMMGMILVVLLAFAFGMYVNASLWRSNKRQT